MAKPNPFTTKRFEEGTEDYHIPFLVRGVRLPPDDKVRWRVEIDTDELVFPEDTGPMGGETLCQVLEKVIAVIREDDFEYG